MIDSALLAPEKPRGLKRGEYERLVALGFFEDERVELLHGTVVQMSPNDPAHASPVERLNTLLLPPLLGRATVRVQLPIVAHDESEPEPDIAVVPIGDYSTAHPTEAHLVIEVAFTSLDKDRNVKAPLYAASGSREYWIVNVLERVVEVSRSVTSGRSAITTRAGVGETLHPEAFPDVAVRVADIFGG